MTAIGAWNCFTADAHLNGIVPGIDRSTLVARGLVEQGSNRRLKDTSPFVLVYGLPPTEVVFAVKHFGDNKYTEWDKELRACLGTPTSKFEQITEWLPTDGRPLFVRLSQKGATAMLLIGDPPKDDKEDHFFSVSIPDEYGVLYLKLTKVGKNAGFIVKNVEPVGLLGTLALERGDILTGLNGNSLQPEDYEALLLPKLGDKLTFTRDGETFTRSISMP